MRRRIARGSCGIGSWVKLQSMRLGTGLRASRAANLVMMVSDTGRILSWYGSGYGARRPVEGDHPTRLAARREETEVARARLATSWDGNGAARHSDRRMTVVDCRYGVDVVVLEGNREDRVRKRGRHRGSRPERRYPAAGTAAPLPRHSARQVAHRAQRLAGQVAEIGVKSGRFRTTDANEDRHSVVDP